MSKKDDSNNCSTSMAKQVTIRQLGLIDYERCWRSMADFTDHRDPNTTDEIWVLQHNPVFTLGQAGKSEHILSAGDIPVIKVDRGGQVTYHGPGQLVIYLLVDLRRLGIGVRQLVDVIEQSIVAYLDSLQLQAELRTKAPGVYINEAKIAALGLRVRRGCSFHGLSFNVDLDLEPFQRINPCGYKGLRVTRLSDLLATAPGIRLVEEGLLQALMTNLGYNDKTMCTNLPSPF